MSRGNHWVTVSGGIDKNVDFYLYDSMNRSEIDNQLGHYCSLIASEDKLLKGYLTFEVKDTTNQKSELCGYYALAYALALSLNLNPERLNFEESEIIKHYDKILNNEVDLTMFPYIDRFKSRDRNPVLKYYL